MIFEHDLSDDDHFDALLRRANEQLTPVPVALSSRIERRLEGAAWRRRIGMTTALAVSVAVVWLASHDWSTPPPPIPPQPPVVVQIDPRPPVKVEVLPGSPNLAVPIESGDPNVVIVMIYPTLKNSNPNRSPQ